MTYVNYRDVRSEPLFGLIGTKWEMSGNVQVHFILTRRANIKRKLILKKRSGFVSFESESDICVKKPGLVRQMFIRDVRFVYKVGQISTKWDISEIFEDQLDDVK